MDYEWDWEGLPEYMDIPDHLATKKGLRRLKLEPIGKLVAALVWQEGKISLYEKKEYAVVYYSFQAQLTHVEIVHAAFV